MSTLTAPHTALTALSGVELSSADSATCSQMLGNVRLLRGWLDAVEAHITSRVTQLHDTAGGAPAADLHSRCGGRSAAERKRKDAQAGSVLTSQPARQHPPGNRQDDAASSGDDPERPVLAMPPNSFETGVASVRAFCARPALHYPPLHG